MNKKIGNIQQEQNNEGKDFYQLLLLNNNSFIVESCDSLFSTKLLKHQPVTEWSPFVESIFEYIINLKSGTPEILFSGVEQPHDNLKGFYDFTFAPINIENNKYILWTIYDYTQLYKELQVHQQRKHELEIQRQNLGNKIHNIIIKNLSLKYKKSLSKEETPLLLKANNLILKNIVTDFEVISPFSNNNINSYLPQTFSVLQLIDNVKNQLEQNEGIELVCYTTEKISKNVIGNGDSLQYIFYELLSLNNYETATAAKLKWSFNEAEGQTYPFLFEIVNPRLSLSDSEIEAVLNEISLDEDNECLFRLNIVLKLISLQNGFVQSIDCQNNQTIIQFSLTCRIID
jgi:hypothetical protein